MHASFRPFVAAMHQWLQDVQALDAPARNALLAAATSWDGGHLRSGEVRLPYILEVLRAVAWISSDPQLPPPSPVLRGSALPHMSLPGDSLADMKSAVLSALTGDAVCHMDVRARATLVCALYTCGRGFELSHVAVAAEQRVGRHPHAYPPSHRQHAHPHAFPSPASTPKHSWTGLHLRQGAKALLARATSRSGRHVDAASEADLFIDDGRSGTPDGSDAAVPRTEDRSTAPHTHSPHRHSGHGSHGTQAARQHLVLQARLTFTSALQPAFARAIAAVLLQTTGLELTQLKDAINVSGAADMFTLVFEDIGSQAPALQVQLLQHFALQAAAVRRRRAAEHAEEPRAGCDDTGLEEKAPSSAPRGRVGLQIISDLDDTLVAGWVESRYTRGAPIPGAIALVQALRRCNPCSEGAVAPLVPPNWWLGALGNGRSAPSASASASQARHAASGAATATQVSDASDTVIAQTAAAPTPVRIDDVDHADASFKPALLKRALARWRRMRSPRAGAAAGVGPDVGADGVVGAAPAVDGDFGNPDDAWVRHAIAALQEEKMAPAAGAGSHRDAPHAPRRHHADTSAPPAPHLDHEGFVTSSGLVQSNDAPEAAAMRRFAALPPLHEVLRQAAAAAPVAALGVSDALAPRVHPSSSSDAEPVASIMPHSTEAGWDEPLTSHDGCLPSSLVVVTARPSDFRGFLKRRTLESLRFLPLGCHVLALLGSLLHSTSTAGIVAKKVDNVMAYAALFPEHDLVLLGDTGQGDAAVYSHVMHRLALAVRACGDATGDDDGSATTERPPQRAFAFLHHVNPDPASTTAPDVAGDGCSISKFYDTPAVREAGLHICPTWVHAADIAARQHGLMTQADVATVCAHSVAQLRAQLRAQTSEGVFDQSSSGGADGDRATNALLSALDDPAGSPTGDNTTVPRAPRVSSRRGDRQGTSPAQIAILRQMQQLA